MKKQILALSLGLMTIGAFAQKNELKAAEKAIKKNDFKSAITVLNSLNSMENSMESKYKAKFYYLKGKAFAGGHDYLNASEAFSDLMNYEKEIGKAKYTKSAAPMLNKLVADVSQKAIKLYNEDKDYKSAATNFYLTYKLSPSPKDTSFVFNAAVLPQIITDIAPFYSILEIKNKRTNSYKTLYYDTQDLRSYIKHHNGKGNRIKVRFREYIESKICFLEVKFNHRVDRSDKYKKWKKDALAAQERIIASVYLDELPQALSIEHSAVLESKIHN